MVLLATAYGRMVRWLGFRANDLAQSRNALAYHLWIALIKSSNVSGATISNIFIQRFHTCEIVSICSFFRRSHQNNHIDRSGKFRQMPESHFSLPANPSVDISVSFVCIADFDCQSLSRHGKHFRRCVECLVELYLVGKPPLDQLLLRVMLVSQCIEHSSLQLPCLLMYPKTCMQRRFGWAIDEKGKQRLVREVNFIAEADMEEIRRYCRPSE